MSMVKLLFSFHGRINRLQYWLGGAMLGIVFGLLLIVVASAALSSPSLHKGAGAFGPLALIALLFIGMLYCSLALQIKRLHDRGRTGWFAAAPIGLLVIIGCIMIGSIASGADAASFAAASAPWQLVNTLIGLVMFVELGCLPSKTGPNKYDGSPGGPSTPMSSPIGGARPSSSASSAPLASAEHALERAIAARSQIPGISNAQKTAAVAAQPAVARAPAPPRQPTASTSTQGAPKAFGRR